MIKTIELKKIINAYLKTKHNRIYFQSAPEDAVYPYIVYDMPNSVDDGSMETFVLDIDGWDSTKDTTTLETLMSVIDGNGNKLTPTGLNKKTVSINGEITATFYRENRLSLVDDDPKIIRKKYIYQIKTHE